MKLCYIPAVSSAATQSVLTTMVSLTDTIVRVSCNILWGVMLLTIITELFKAVRNKDYSNFAIKLRDCAFAGVVILILQWFPTISNIISNAIQGLVG